MDHLIRNIAFSSAKGMTCATATEMLRRINSVDNFFDLPPAQLATMASVDADIFDDVYRKSLLKEAGNEATWITANGIKATFAASDDYPKRLRDCDDAPAMLFSLGNCNLDSPHTIGIVGTRHATPYGIDFTTRLVTDLAKKIDGLVVVSGLAYGIDVAAHKAAMNCDVPTVGVLAHGLNMIYPADHRSIAAKMLERGGALVTEYPSSSRIHRSNFLARNRIVAGLCDCLVVVESDYRGGSMSTARIALQYHRDVFAVPGRVNDPYSRGTNYLIYNNTAVLLRNADDIILQMGWTQKEKEETPPQLIPTLPPDQQTLYDYIIAHPQATSNEMCVALGLTYAQVSNLIFELEMKDMIISMPGGTFAPSTR